jgi:hypothetical protein
MSLAAAAQVNIHATWTYALRSRKVELIRRVSDGERSIWSEINAWNPLAVRPNRDVLGCACRTSQSRFALVIVFRAIFTRLIDEDNHRTQAVGHLLCRLSPIDRFVKHQIGPTVIPQFRSRKWDGEQTHECLRLADSANGWHGCGVTSCSVACLTGVLGKE